MYAIDQIQERMKPFHFGDGRPDRSTLAFLFQTGVLLLSLFGFTACLTSLYLGMRGLMRLGGMVASGGPYAIAHPAPGWAWVVPISILAAVVFVGLNFYASRRVGGFDVLVLAWPATFLSLGWNFLQFSFPAAPGRVIWGWLVCGVVFAVMGGIPLIFVLTNAVKALTGRERSSLGSAWAVSDEACPARLQFRLGRTSRLAIILLQLAAIGLGIVAAVRLVQALL